MFHKLIRFWLAPISKASTNKKTWKRILNLLLLIGRVIWKILKLLEGDGTE